MPPAGPARVLLWLLCLALQLVAVRNMWIDVRLADGQALRARFEDPQSRPALALTECCGEEFFPGPGIDAHGAIAVSPGLIVAAVLERDETLVVTTDDGTPAPYVVFGTRHSAAAAEWLADPRRLDPGAAGVQLVGWDGGRPWREDARWLSALSERCGGSETRSLRVTTATDHTEVRLGNCPPVSVRTSAGEPLLMAVLAGPSWVTIGREPGFRVDRKLNTGALDPLVLLAIISVAGLFVVGTGTLVTVSAGLLAASFLVPIAAWLGFVGVVIIVVIGAVARLAARVVPLRRRWMRVCVGYMGVAILLLAIVGGVQRAVRGGFSERHWMERPEGAGARCQLVGYSPVANAQLRVEAGVSSMLAACPACSGGLDVAARHGGRLDWTRRQVCSDEPSQAVVAIGGDNDDMLWARGLMDLGRHLRAMLRFGSAVYARTVRPDYLSRTLDAFAESAIRSADEQEAALQAATRCAHDRGARFVFVHDLFIEDLAFGRSPMRHALLERRRNAVAPDGHERFFVDALAAFPDMGVSWFNDMRHPSLIGHRKIAERVCDILQRAPATPPTTASPAQVSLDGAFAAGVASVAVPLAAPLSHWRKP